MTTATPFPFARRGPMRLSFAIGLTVLGVFGLVPAVAVLVLSFTDIRGLPGLPVAWVGLQNYVDFFGPAHFSDNLNALRNTVVFAVVTTLVQIAVALVIALLLNRKLRGTSFYRAVVFMPTVLGVTVIGLIWSLVFNPTGGPAAAVLQALGTHSAFFGDPAITLGLVMFVQIWTQIGMSVVIFIAGLQAIPEEVMEAAAIDGASPWQRLRLVTIPMLAPSVTTNVIFGIVNALQSYQLAYVLTGPNNRATQLLSTEIFVQGFGGVPGTQVSQSQGYAAAISILQFVLVGVISLLALAYLRRREARL
jgi:ABC-type sugar transport system permease subunit